MNRGFWFLGEVLAGLFASGLVSAIATPLLMRAGRDPGPTAPWFVMAVSVALCIVLGELVRRGRRRDRAS